MESEKLVVVEVEMFGSLVDGVEVVGTVMLPAVSLTTGARVKLSSVGLPSTTWTLWTVIDVYLCKDNMLEDFNSTLKAP